MHFSHLSKPGKGEKFLKPSPIFHRRGRPRATRHSSTCDRDVIGVGPSLNWCLDKGVGVVECIQFMPRDGGLSLRKVEGGGGWKKNLVHVYHHPDLPFGKPPKIGLIRHAV
ncbi:hypothetical protein CDAR_394211 [Caerostris darwini]|uniref:Uncharacterized protein n=1 Tax=Caerostris darwini TaxID=1538125 RepID=A0AAV4RJD6_9ARAC|nr:hypothetical protein CDAR_394211 [Caerostris darwini]